MDCVVGQQRVYSGELRFINGDYICDDCAHDVARLFERALEHEVEYPPRYGSNLIDVRPYLEYLPTTFLRDYTIRRRDYDTDAEQMVQHLEYQLCPNPTCQAPTFLGEGCNHMICPYYRTHFCHLCGHAAPEHSGHWLPGGCPRYGQPNVPHPQFDYPTDEHGNVIDDETDEDTEDEAPEESGPLIPDEPTLVL
nr:hypothetical protein B0A51_08604 [Rachicladosporium sp. CCFEE 5018]